MGGAGWGALAGGVSDLMSGILGTIEARHTSAMSRRFARQVMMNRHQWEVQDLKNAGLNPVLSAGGTPGGVGASMTPAPVAAFSGVGESAREVPRRRAEIEALEAGATASRSQAVKAHADTGVAEQSARLVAEQAEKTRVEREILERNIPKADVEKDVMEDVRDLYFKGRRYLERETSSSTSKNPAEFEAIGNAVRRAWDRIKRIDESMGGKSRREWLRR